MDTETRTALKAAGGPEYEALLVYERAARAKWRARHPEKAAAGRKQRKRKTLKTELCRRARQRARKSGLQATITVADLVWPKKCPVLGIELDYATPRGERDCRNPALPSLDRWDNSKGYVPGNVFVISLRANALKNDATWQELFAVMQYARGKVDAVRRTRFPTSFRRYSVIEAEAA